MLSDAEDLEDGDDNDDPNSMTNEVRHILAHSGAISGPLY
jgi:hypothetical protein